MYIYTHAKLILNIYKNKNFSINTFKNNWINY